MTAIQKNETDLVQEFREFEKVNGPSYIYGHITAPYDGCFYLHACAIVRGEFAFVTADLSSYKGGHRGIDYAQYVIPAYEQPDDLNYLGNMVGCVRLSDIDKVLSEPERSGLEFHPLSNLAPNVPNALVEQVLNMCRDLEYGALVEGQFRCAYCEIDLLHVDREFGISYLESEFKGNGGVGIDKGAPLCYDCYIQHKCCHCDSEVPPECQCVDDDEHCIYCAPAIECARCGEDIDLSWGANADDLAGYREGHCGDCHNQGKVAEIENQRYGEIAAVTGVLL